MASSWGWVLLEAGLAGALTVLVFYPLVLGILGLRRHQPVPPDPQLWPTVTGIVVMRNAASLLRAKVENCRSVDYPEDAIEWLFYSDGSTDDTVTCAEACLGSRMSFVSESRHLGKITGLNRLAAAARGEVLLFSDVDGILAPDSVKQLVRHLQDPGVGGVSGRRVFDARHEGIRGAQAAYVHFDTYIKLGESRLGCATSNDGKLYVVRRSLFEPIPDGVTDDFYAALTVLVRGSRFLYDDLARVAIRVPSSDARHEIARRRRIVSTSLNGVFMRPQLLNPLRSGWFAFALFINKVLRRFLPLFLLLILTGLALLAPDRPTATLVILAVAFGWVLLARSAFAGRFSHKYMHIAHYFIIGNIGTLVGLVDWARGRVPTRWNPVKTDIMERSM